MGLTTMMQQYLAIKDQYKDAIVFFRLGDFYEMFFDDAITASRELELTLTGRDCGLPERAPMCGVPYHAVETHLAKLIQRGYHVAICEQMTPPGKGELVKRQVVRLVTPGTITENSILVEDKNNYLLSAYSQDGKIGVAWADISTGEFNYSFIDENVTGAFNDLLCRIEPSEIICNDAMLAESRKLPIVKNRGMRPFNLYDNKAYAYKNALEKLKPQISPENLQAIRNNRCICAAGALIAYIEETQKCALKNFSSLNLDVTDRYMYIDANARRTLELTQSLSDGKTRGTLFWCLDRTKTGMGARLLKHWIVKPEINEDTIGQRLDFVDTMQANAVLCQTLRDVLNDTYDIERLTSRLAFRSIVPVDFLALSRSLRSATQLKALLQPINVPLAQTLAENIYDFTDEYELIDSVIFDANLQEIDEEVEGEGEEPLTDSDKKKKNKEEKEKKKENKGRIFKDSYDAQLDEARNIIKNAKTILKGMLEVEKEATGIKNLKLGFNNVFGYYLEVPKAQIDLVPYRYTRKQTIATGERYITEELKELEEKILHAQTDVESREAELYQAFIDRISQRIHDYLHTARHVAMLDVLLSLAVVAKENNYTKPVVHSEGTICIKEGRHAIVEKLLRDEAFVPNDTYIDDNESRIMLITGPNMAGKSIYMKQVALIAIMAQMGSFIPAAEGSIGITDKIFTRVGASDDLSTGRSTFMVEMSEVTNILQNATAKSLVLMDEIGRGTSTFDGLSIAWSIMEFLSQTLKTKVLFSTHYHELTDLEGKLDGVKNYKLTVRELNNSIVFLRKLMRGSANRSFGIEVAALAGLPDKVIMRAKEILKHLEASDLGKSSALNNNTQQLSLFSASGKTAEIVRILHDLDIDAISPRGALDILADLKEKAEIE